MSALRGRRIELWVEARDGVAAVNPVIQALLDEIETAGAATAVRVPEHEIVDPRHLLGARQPDLVLLKSATTLALSLAIADEAAGVRFLNSARATISAHDKAATVARLAAAGLPVPATFLVAAAAPDAVPASAGGWVVKPVRGVHGHGVSVHANIAAAVGSLASSPRVAGYVVDDGTRLVQRQVGGEGQPDVKVYVTGETIFAGAKRFSTTSYTSNLVTEQALDRRTAEVVRAVGPALGLRCFGVDLRLDGADPYIIDANPFPGYRGFPGAIAALFIEIRQALESRS